jgi:hypothetical protein
MIDAEQFLQMEGPIMLSTTNRRALKLQGL